MNESLSRALVAARLGEEDVAARLGVDPKTCGGGWRAGCRTGGTGGRWPRCSARTTPSSGPGCAVGASGRMR